MCKTVQSYTSESFDYFCGAFEADPYEFGIGSGWPMIPVIVYDDQNSRVNPMIDGKPIKRIINTLSGF